MLFFFRKFTSSILAPVLGTACLMPAAIAADDHVVSPAELRKELKSAATARQANVARLERFLASDAARKAMASTKLDAAKVSQAVALLSDQEIARLAAQADRIDNDIAAGRLTNTQVTYIIFGAILIIVLAIVVR